MNKTEAQRIAAAVNILRPEWSTGLLMMVLGDDRMIRRPFADAVVALTACAIDSTTQKPGRVHEQGPWWLAVAALSRGGGPAYREARLGECIVCGDVRELHGGHHEYQNPLDPRPPGVGPTPEQRAVLVAARVDAERARTAERVPVPKRVPRDPATVVAAHTEQTEQKEIANG